MRKELLCDMWHRLLSIFCLLCFLLLTSPSCKKKEKTYTIKYTANPVGVYSTELSYSGADSFVTTIITGPWETTVQKTGLGIYSRMTSWSMNGGTCTMKIYIDGALKASSGCTYDVTTSICTGTVKYEGPF